MGCLGTVICALISTIFIVYITEINPDMMFLLAALLKKRNWLKKNNHKTRQPCRGFLRGCYFIASVASE